MARFSWLHTATRLAYVMSERSTCNRLNVGCCVINDRGHVLVLSYNGAPSGLPSCDEVGHMVIDNHCQRVLHAESNGIVIASRLGISIDGATMVLTHEPCRPCANKIIQAGIRRIVFMGYYRPEQFGDTRAYLESAGVVVRKYPEEVQ